MGTKRRQSQNGKPAGQITRREFIQVTGAIAGAAAIGSAFSACCSQPPTSTTPGYPTTTLPKGTILSPDTLRANRIPPHQHQVDNWPVLQAGGIQEVDTNEWRFSISGLVEQEIQLDYTQFLSLETVYVFSDIHCVTGWSRLSNLWKGFSPKVILDMAAPKPGAKFVIVHAAGGFTTNLTMTDFLEEDVLFAVEHDMEPLTAPHGWPVRLVVPRLYFWKSAKWVTGIELTDEDRPGYWESRGYHNRGNPWSEERFQNII